MRSWWCVLTKSLWNSRERFSFPQIDTRDGLRHSENSSSSSRKQLVEEPNRPNGFQMRIAVGGGSPIEGESTSINPSSFYLHGLSRAVHISFHSGLHPIKSQFKFFRSRIIDNITKQPTERHYLENCISLKHLLFYRIANTKSILQSHHTAVHPMITITPIMLHESITTSNEALEALNHTPSTSRRNSIRDSPITTAICHESYRLFKQCSTAGEVEGFSCDSAVASYMRCAMNGCYPC